jgi:hypothetical protein
LSEQNFLFYTTSGCHLCETALAVIHSLQKKAPSFFIRSVDISNDPVLVDRYGIRIPVLRNLSSDSELDWPFDEDMLAEFIEVDD